MLKVTSASLAPIPSKLGVSQCNSFSLTKIPYTSGGFGLPLSNLTTMLPVSLNPSPIIVTFVLPVKGPKFGDI